MALSKTAKIWIVIISVPVVLIIGGIIALKLYFTSERLKAMILPEIEKATHRTITVGDVSLQIIPTFGIEIDSLTISNPKGLTFDKLNLLSLERLVLDVKLWQLLKNKLEIENLLLVRPNIYLETTEDGKSNYGTVEDKIAEDTTDTSLQVRIRGVEHMSLLLSNLEIKDGVVEWVDKKGNSRLILDGYMQTASAEVKRNTREIHFQSTISIDKINYGTLTSWYFPEIPLASQWTLTYNEQNDVLTFDEVSIKLKDLPLTIEGSIGNLLTDARDIDMTITSPGIQMAQLLSLVPPEMLKATAGISSAGNVKFSLTIKGLSSETMNPEIKGLFNISNGKIQYSALPKAITNILINGMFEIPAADKKTKGIGSFVIEDLTASLGNSNIAAFIRVTNFDDPFVKASVLGAVNLNEVKEYYPLEQETEITGTMSANVSLEGKAKLPTSIKAKGDVEFVNVAIKTPTSMSPLHNLSGTITFNNQIIESQRLAMNIGESDLSMAFTMKNYIGLVMEEAAASSKPSASITLTSKQLRTIDLISETESTESVQKNKQPQTQKAMLPAVDIDANVNIARLITEKFEFTNARGSVSFSNGIATLRNFSVNAFEGTVVSRGTLDLQDLKKRPFNLNLDIVGVEANALLPKFTSFGNNIFGKFTMSAALQGNLDDTLGLNTQSLMGNGTVQIYDGKLVGLALLAKLADFTGLSELREVQFSNWSNAFTIANGKMNINNLSVMAAATDFRLSGEQGLDGTMNHNLSVKLSQALSNKARLTGAAEQLMQFFKDTEGRITLDFAVTGTTNNPSLRLDTQRQEEMAKKATEQKIQEAKKKLEDELKKKGEEELKKLFRKP